MSELFDLALDAYGGLERWRDVRSLNLHVSLTDGLYHLNGFREAVPEALCAQLNEVQQKNIMSSMLLKGKTALITGGNSAIGLATARRFVAEGARVAITGRDAAKLAGAANELGVTAIKSYVLDTQARSSLFDRIKNEFGYLDILFANAGIRLLRQITNSKRTMIPMII
jgi:FlaA1/EpsC-like NDP-sugar epimerase